jgi:uncharacterized protein YjbJ (UPF0337 family)
MEFEIKIKLDWIHDEDTLDDAVKRKLVNEIVNGLSAPLIQMLSKESVNKVNYSVDSFVTDILSKFMDRKIRITDNYGSVKHEYEDVEEMLKEKFDNFINQPVDGKGSPLKGKCSYGEDISRLEFMIKKNLRGFEEKLNTKIKRIVGDMKSELLGKLDTKFDSEVTNQFIQEILPKIKLKE